MVYTGSSWVRNNNCKEKKKKRQLEVDDGVTNDE